MLMLNKISESESESIRKQTFGFIGRLRKSCNTIVQTLENAWIIRIQLWHTWFGVLYTNR